MSTATKIFFKRSKIGRKGKAFHLCDICADASKRTLIGGHGYDCRSILPAKDSVLPENSGTFELILPSDPRWAEHQFHMAQRRAASLSNHGWKFFESEGPRGTYYEGFGPNGMRVMSEQKRDTRAAFLAAVNHAFDVQFGKM